MKFHHLLLSGVYEVIVIEHVLIVITAYFINDQCVLTYKFSIFFTFIIIVIKINVLIYFICFLMVVGS